VRLTKDCVCAAIVKKRDRGMQPWCGGGMSDLQGGEQGGRSASVGQCGARGGSGGVAMGISFCVLCPSFGPTLL
jgi:hypothetical protein